MPDQTGEMPYSWAIKSKWLNTPDKLLAPFLNQPQAQIFSSILRKTFEWAYQSPLGEDQMKAFKRRLHGNIRDVIAALYELSILSLLRIEQWTLVGIESEEVGSSRPDYLLRPRNGSDMLVEVRTLFPSDRMLAFDRHISELKQYFTAELRKRGIYAKELTISTDIYGIKEMEEQKAIAMKSLYSEAIKRRRMGMKNILVALPGGIVTLNQEGIHYSGPTISKKKIADEMARQAYALYAAKMQGFHADNAKEKDYSNRIEKRIKTKDSQILKSGSNAGAVIAICLADHDISVSEALRYARAGLERRITSAGKANIHTILIFSFHWPEIERLKKKISPEKVDPLNQMEARLPVAVVQVAWINITDTAPKPNILKTIPISSDNKLNLPELEEHGIKHIMFLMEDLIDKEFA